MNIIYFQVIIYLSTQKNKMKFYKSFISRFFFFFFFLKRDKNEINLSLSSLFNFNLKHGTKIDTD